MEAPRSNPCLQLPLPREGLQDVIDKAKDWALLHGIGMRSKEVFSKDHVQILPFTLLPSTFPREQFRRAKSIQTLLNELMHKVAHNSDFLKSSLKSTIEADPFTAKLFQIYETVQKIGHSQKISVGLLRSDYLLHGGAGNEIKQVELNTIASSFGGITTVISRYHRYILTELGHVDKLKNIPENDTITGLCNGLISAWTLYGDPEAVVLFVVEEVTYNICDQRFHEFRIRELNSNVRIVRKSLKDLVTLTSLGPDKELIVGGQVVSVVYFRSGYEVEAYPTESEWNVRSLIEQSRAIKCPSIQYHLAGTKKVQQSLARPGALDIFFDDSSKIKRIQEVFAGLYSLEFNEEAEKIIDAAISEPSKYVLKPQREGGGNNVYGEEMSAQLQAMRNSMERTAWILMDRLNPPVQSNFIIRATKEPPTEDNDFYLSDVVSELGVYGVIIGDHDTIIENHEVGHILRTKPATENEGGIAAGVAAVDSPYLDT